jgi:hypothetical protein
MINKYNKQKDYYKQKSFWSKCLCSNNIAYFVSIIGIILLLILIVGMLKRISIVKEQLDSCRSSCKSD